MKTTCYCIFCKKHPLHKDYMEGKLDEEGVRVPVGDSLIYKPEEIAAGKEVDCLDPDSDAFYELKVEAEDFDWPETHYIDGYAGTETIGPGFEIYASCEAEDHEDR